MKQNRNRKDRVVLIHGLGGSRLDMWPIRRSLKQRFDVKNWGYRSWRNHIEEHANQLAAYVRELDSHDSGRIHLVAHSMGGIIARKMFAKFKFKNIGRVVMLAPPHRGSHVARKLKHFLGWLSPSLEQLSDEPDSFVNQLPNSFLQNRIEFGIIESTKDRVIEQGGVHLDGFRDYAKVDGHHGLLPWNSRAIRYVENFLVEGKFQATANSYGDHRAVTVESFPEKT